MMLHRLVPLLMLLRSALSITLNIHLPLNKVNFTWGWEQCPYDSALEANLALRQSNRDTEQINFFSLHSPHVTLFLSNFEVTNMTEAELIKKISSTVKQVVSNRTQIMCEVTWPADPKSVQVHGSYAMYPIAKTACLQQLSDDIVLALNPYIRRPPDIPAWIRHLPLIPRWRKMFLVRKYGSPNVFGDFDPHVTVGFDEETSVDSRQTILRGLPALGLECKGTLSTLSIAKVGIGGSVLQDGVVHQIQLYETNEIGVMGE